MDPIFGGGHWVLKTWVHSFIGILAIGTTSWPRVPPRGGGVGGTVTTRRRGAGRAGEWARGSERRASERGIARGTLGDLGGRFMFLCGSHLRVTLRAGRCPQKLPPPASGLGDVAAGRSLAHLLALAGFWILKKTSVIQTGFALCRRLSGPGWGCHPGVGPAASIVRPGKVSGGRDETRVFGFRILMNHFVKKNLFFYKFHMHSTQASSLDASSYPVTSKQWTGQPRWATSIHRIHRLSYPACESDAFEFCLPSHSLAIPEFGRTG